ncbi:putative eukaryotic translation initiation factor 3 subunit J [Helianthus annuus]|nr:putative eukaryotic translation initiation factor 3 subunit J [Helianthus annuus]KAJ0447179.1 putative eukaryotic translation initiation factor 3 subunit J [Helianthus annuus]KAJ0632087.1 putative eukaryotic translation initiation factor 3 subunit J [Helianthus annuus]KAJ0825905.1 putative eukaryotic translation initiation factor 3 subunit J [Helianthus annuus]
MRIKRGDGQRIIHVGSILYVIRKQKLPSCTPGVWLNGHLRWSLEPPVVAEKLRQQRYEPWKPLVEEADYKNTAELFASKKDDDKTTDNFIPKSESDFLQYAQLISNKLRPFEKSFHNWVAEACNEIVNDFFKSY